MARADLPLLAPPHPSHRHPRHRTPPPSAGGEGEGEGEEGPSLLRRRFPSNNSQRVNSKLEIVRDNEAGAHSSNKESEGEEDLMSFSSLQRRKRELLASAKR